MTVLEYTYNGESHHLELFPEREYFIGRDASCAICFPDHAKLSRRHSVVYFNTNLREYCVADMNSTNGTFLNGSNIGHKDTPLHNGDIISAGSENLTFHDPSSGETSVETHSTKLQMFARIPLGKNKERISVRKSAESLFPLNSHFGKCIITEILEDSDIYAIYLMRDADQADVYKALWVFKELPSDFSSANELNSIFEKFPKDLPGVMPYIGGGILDSGECYFYTDYLGIPSFAQLITVDTPRSAERVMPLIYSIALILRKAEHHGLIHGYLTPTQMLYSPHLGNRIVGMGLGPWLQKFFHDFTSVHGLWYASPELLTGEKLVWQSDLYALGIIAFQLLTGVLPFRSDSPAELAKMHIEMPLPALKERNPLVSVPHEISTVLIRMTMKDPAQRYASWSELLHDLSKINSQFNKNKTVIADVQ